MIKCQKVLRWIVKKFTNSDNLPHRNSQTVTMTHGYDMDGTHSDILWCITMLSMSAVRTSHHPLRCGRDDDFATKKTSLGYDMDGLRFNHESWLRNGWITF